MSHFIARYRLVYIIYAFLFALLLSKVFYLQVFRGVHLSREASVQRLKNYQVEKNRGDILDRNGIRFTNRSTKAMVAIMPSYFDADDNTLQTVCTVLETEQGTIRRGLETRRGPLFIETSACAGMMIADMDLGGVSVIHSLKRYDRQSAAVHVLGYLNGIDFSGDAGIERFYNEVLEYDHTSIVGAITDARRNIIKGMGYRMFEMPPRNRKLNVKLTLDYHIQKEVEDIMDKAGVSGAVVVEDVNNGDIVAMASKPDFDTDSVAEYMDSAGNELFNKAAASYDLGSVFKIVDAAAALENGIEVPEYFRCEGFLNLGDKVFKCASYSSGGHGVLDFESAFARSCNTFFINLGLKTGYRNLLETASLFGLGEITGIMYQGVEESAGNIPSPDATHSIGDIANISIGQGTILATPVQVADIAATIANGGIKNRINIVDSIVDDEGNLIRNIRVDEGTRIIEKKTANAVRHMMEQVIDYGTASSVDLGRYGGAAGKTGSAETGQYIKGKKVVHAWFAGYFPERNPRYAVAVFVENGIYGGRTAAPIFERIAEAVMKRGL